MAQIKVVVTFLYDTEQDISDWNTEVDHTHVTTKDEAIATAIAEIDANGSGSLYFDVFDEDGELM